MTKKDTGPLTWNVPIVNRAGLPSSEFQRRWETLRTNDNLLQTVEVGKGVPKTTPADGEAYVDMSVSPAVLYVGDNGKWRITGTLPSAGTIVGPPGQDGEEGPMGPPGPQGLAGATGATGATGPAGVSPALARSVVQQQCSSYNAGQTTAGFTTCILPTAPTQGNLLVAIMQWNNVNGTPAAGTGWTLAAYDHTTTNPFGVMSALFWKYAGAGESTSQTPGNAGLTYGSTNIWEISGVSGTWATDFVAFSFNDAPAGQPVLAFTDGGYTTANANSLVLAFIGGNNSIGYATPTAMTQIGAGTLVPDTHIGATGGPSGVSAVAGHYTSVTTAGTVLKGHSSSANSSSWFSAYVELTSGSLTPGATGATGPAGSPGPAGRDGEDGEDGLRGPPGQAGATGATGPQGIQGLMGFGRDGEDGEDGLRGPPGVVSSAGPALAIYTMYAEDQRQEDYPNWPPGQISPEGATDSETPASPSQPTSNIAFTMAGLAGSITPKQRGLVLIIVKATVTISGTGVIGDGLAMQIMVGTGTAPVNGAAVTGTAVGNFAQRQLGANLGGAGADRSDLCCVGFVQLTPGTTYWIDVQQEQKSVNNRAQLVFPSIVAVET